MTSEDPPKTFRAAQYVRMSTEHQQYSTHNQADKIQEYADRRGIEIVRTYADEGKSGLSIDGRASLQKLIADVESGNTDFNLILVYDVSRWGRFQDADESAYYEYICKRKGIAVAYVAEQFENDGSPVSTIVKGVKRAMAGEYSRELSAKVFAGQCRLIEMGFRQGGPAGFGLRRVLIDQTGAIKGELKNGEHKSLQTDRVILMPGPDHEVATVLQMFTWFIQDDLPLAEIAKRLNDQGIRTDNQRPWTYSTVRQVLTNEKYIGNNVYNRHSFKLKKLHVNNPPAMWIRKEGAFEGIVPLDTFLKAQEVLAERTRRYSDEELLAHLKQLYADCGTLSGLIIDQAPGLPCAITYAHRFGSLTRAYELVGFHTSRDQGFIEINRRLRQLHPEIVRRTEETIAEMGGSVRRDGKTDLLTLNDELVISLVLARCHTLPNGQQRWRIRFDTERFSPDITVAVRLDAQNANELDYYLLPRLDLAEMVLQALAEVNAAVTAQGGRAPTAKTTFSMVRFGNVLGSSGSVVPLFREQIKNGGPITLTHADITRYFMTIPEAAQLVIQAGAMGQGGDVFVLDMGQPVKIIDLARRMVELSGLTVRDELNPSGDIELTVTGLRPGEKLYEELLIGDNPKPTQHPRIMKAHEQYLTWPQLEGKLNALSMAMGVNDVPVIRALLKDLVSGYQPSGEVVDWVHMALEREALANE